MPSKLWLKWRPSVKLLQAAVNALQALLEMATKRQTIERFAKNQTRQAAG